MSIASDELGLVLLPGLDGSGVMFRPLLDHFPHRPRPIVLRLPNAELGYDELLPIVLDQLPREPFVLLGESFSGPLALKTAATRPASLRGVVLCASFIRSPAPFGSRWIRHLARPLPFRFFPIFSRLKAAAGGYLTPELRVLSHEATAGVPPEVLAGRVRAVLGVDVREELRACPVPVLYLRGRRDRVVPRRCEREITSVLPSVQVAQIDAPHWLLQTQPAAAAVELRAFMRRLGPGLSV